jgi:ABC transport system ATP-binding/permease protein
MAIISLQDVSVSFGNLPLLDQVELQVEKGERIALIGRNGEGKTSLLRLIAGELPPDTGRVTLQKGLTLAGLTQDVPPTVTGSVREVVGGGSAIADHRVDTVLTRLALNADERFEALSVGFKRRVLLARALASEPDVLLLDEPTNHLDITTITWLEEYLHKYRGTLMLVTHDRVFLRKLATRIVELDRGRLTSWACDYHNFLERREAAAVAEEAQRNRFMRKLAQEEIWIRQGVKARRTRNEGRVRALLKLRAEQQALRTQTGDVRMQIEEAQRTGKLVIEAKGITQAFGAQPLIHDFSVRIMRGDRIGIIGPNGIGKTTLLRILLGEIPPQKGQVRHGTHLQPVYFDQLRAQLDETRSVQENIAAGEEYVDLNGQRRHVISYLKDFLFAPERARGPVRVLSGGERNRLLLARLFCRPSNVLVLDEPTNDLDMETLDLLEERLMDYSGTILLVSHDRAFLNGVVTSTLVFESGGKLTEYAGGYDDWLAQRPAAGGGDAAAARAAPRKPSEKREKPRKLTFNETRELSALPGQIEALESEQQALVAQLADPGFYKQGGEAVGRATARLVQVESALENAYARWQALESIRTGAEG